MSATNPLVDWQVRQAKEFIHSNLGSRLRIKAVAKMDDQSVIYFTRTSKEKLYMLFIKFKFKPKIVLKISCWSRPRREFQNSR